MTSDVVPAGSRHEVTREGAADDAASRAAETAVNAGEGPVVNEAGVAAGPDDGVAAPNGSAAERADGVDEVTAPAARGIPDVSEVSDDTGADAGRVEGRSPEDSTAGEANARDDAPSDESVTSAASPDANNADEDTEPAAKSDELWTPEESEPPAATVPAADLSRAHLKGLIEALVFVADQPVSLQEIAKAAGRADRKLVRALADELRQDYARRGIHLDEVAGGLLFRTNPAYAPFIRDAVAKKPVRMTRAQLETLAIIAYRQPLTRPEVDEVRGVDSGPVMRMLLERDLIKILGKKDEPGRPLLYGTTHNFLEFFGLKALKDLPSLREFTELSDDSRRAYEREMGDSPDAPTDPDLTTLAAAASAAGTENREEAPGDLAEGPRTLRPESVPTDWFDRPTEPDTTVDALGSKISAPNGESVESEAATSDGPSDAVGDDQDDSSAGSA